MMLRLLTVALLLSSSFVSAQTTLDITLPGGAVCSYATGAVSNGAAPGHLQATATSETGAGCGSQAGVVTFGPASPAVAVPGSLGSNIGTSSINFQVLNANTCVGSINPATNTSFTGGSTLCSGSSCQSPVSAIANFDNETASAITYVVTVTCNGTSGQAVSTANVVVPKKGDGGGTCYQVANSAPGSQPFTRATTAASSLYPNTPVSRDATNYTTIYADAGFPNWPGHYNAPGYILLPTSNFVSLAFTVPHTFFSGVNLNVYGNYTISESTSGYSAPISMSISTKCGDFSSPTDTGSTVVCRGNKLISDNALTWYSTGTACKLQNDGQYFLNIINADIQNVTANGGGTATSSANAKCTGGKCSDVIANGIGSWH